MMKKIIGIVEVIVALALFVYINYQFDMIWSMYGYDNVKQMIFEGILIRIAASISAPLGWIVSVELTIMNFEEEMRKEENWA